MIRRLQEYFRCGRRMIALAAALAFHAAAFVAVAEHRRGVAARARWLSRTCRAVLRAIGVRASAVGRQPAAGVVVCNHLGYLDILVLASQTPVVFVAKREVRDWPIFGWFARMAGTQFVDRARRGDVVRVAAQLSPVLAAGVSVVLFLEGTSSDGREVHPFKPSLLDPVVRGGMPVMPAAISYVAPPGHSAATEICWWGDMTLTRHLLNLLSLHPVQAYLGWGEPIAGENDRKKLAALAHGRVIALHRALSGCDHASLEGATAQPQPSSRAVSSVVLLSLCSLLHPFLSMCASR